MVIYAVILNKLQDCEEYDWVEEQFETFHATEELANRAMSRSLREYVMVQEQAFSKHLNFDVDPVRRQRAINMDADILALYRNNLQPKFYYNLENTIPIYVVKTIDVET